MSRIKDLDIKVKRITNHSNTNTGKLNKLSEHFVNVQLVKNVMSEYIFDYISKNTFHSDNIYSLKLQSKQFKTIANIPHNLSSWEIQKIFFSIIDFYNNQYISITKNKKFFKFIELDVKKYKRNSSDNTFKKGDIKEIIVKKNTTIISKLLNYVKFVDYEKLDKYELPIESNKVKLSELNYKLFNKTTEIKDSIKIKKTIKSLENKIEMFTVLSVKFKEIKKDKLKYKFFKNTIKIFQDRVRKRIYLMEFQSGSYVKCAVFNKNSKKPTKHSYYFVNNELKLYKHWYKFKLDNEEIILPMAFNEKYHNEDFHLDKEHYVSYKLGKINVGLSYDVENVKYKTNSLDDKLTKIIGCDLNVRDNFLSWNDGEEAGDFDYDRKYINDFVAELKVLDKLSADDKKLDKNKKQLEYLVRVNEWYFKNKISDILKEFDKRGITDIVLENLDLSKSSASYVKSEEFQIKYSRLIRLLRLSNIKDWMSEQAKKFGIRVHLTNPAYTSQECSECHVIVKSNRNGAIFKCATCGHEEHSDYNSPKIIRSRISEDVLRYKFHNSNDNEIFTPKIMKHKNIKIYLDEYYESLNLVKVNIKRLPRKNNSPWLATE